MLITDPCSTLDIKLWCHGNTSNKLMMNKDEDVCIMVSSGEWCVQLKYRISSV